MTINLKVFSFGFISLIYVFIVYLILDQDTILFNESNSSTEEESTNNKFLGFLNLSNETEE